MISLSCSFSRVEILFSIHFLKYGSGSIMFWGIMSSGTGILHKVGRIMKEDYLQIVQLHLK